jgi:hypothetical protein
MSKTDCNEKSFIEKLKRKLSAAGIELGKVDRFKKNVDIAYFPRRNGWLEIDLNTNIMPAIILNSNIEDYELIWKYDAIWSPSNKTLECGLVKHYKWLRKLAPYASLFSSESEEAKKKTLLATFDNDLQVYLMSPPSMELRIYDHLYGCSYHSRYVCSEYSLVFENIKADSHDEIVAIMQELSNSVLLNLDINTPLGLQLKKTNPCPVSCLWEWQKETPNDSWPPQRAYDFEPMELYWLARQLEDTPLHSYLAFYQVIEYYFPKYSKQELRNKAKQIILERNFSADSDSCIDDLIRTISDAKHNIKSERNQLISTIGIFVTSADIAAKFQEFDELTTHFINGYYSEISDKKISIDKYLEQTHNSPNSPKANLVKECAERIYDIRCQIVHTKSCKKFMLPYSREVRMIPIELSLIRLVARMVLVGASKPLP